MCDDERTISVPTTTTTTAGYQPVSNDPYTSTALSTKANVEWTSLVPSVVSSRHLACTEHTPSSAELIRASLEAFCDGTTLSLDVEDALFEAFLEDDYDGRLHLTTLDDNDSDGVPIGLIFWREVPEEEMQNWLDFDALSALWSSAQVQKTQQIGSDSDSGGDIADIRMSGLLAAREESVRWLSHSSSRALNKSSAALGQPSLPVADGLTQAWVKIELLAVRKQYWGRRYGTLLLACALLQAYNLNNSRSLLHVAGGRSNVPAVRLYSKFGFLPVEQGTFFHKPDKDLFVLGNIGRSLEQLAWSEMWGEKRIGEGEGGHSASASV